MELIRAGRIDLVINTPFGRGPRTDGYHIRTAAAATGVPCLTTMQGAFAAVRGIEASATEPPSPSRSRSITRARGRGRSRSASGSTWTESALPGRGWREARVRAEVLSTRKMGAYHQLTIVAPRSRRRRDPGQFVSVRMPVGREFLLRRHLAIHDASRRGGGLGRSSS